MLLLPLVHFNSIKVRLKLGVGTLLPIDYRNFNSIKVRLKLSRKVEFWDADKNFNSIKVRLKREFANRCFASSIIQFHKGTIETFEQPFYNEALYSISIP